MRTRFLALPFTLALVGCGDPAKPAPTPTVPAPVPPTATGPQATTKAASEGSSKAMEEHGASFSFSVQIRLGAGAFEVALVKGPTGATVNTVALYAWV